MDHLKGGDWTATGRKWDAKGTPMHAFPQRPELRRSPIPGSSTSGYMDC